MYDRVCSCGSGWGAAGSGVVAAGTWAGAGWERLGLGLERGGSGPPTTENHRFFWKNNCNHYDDHCNKNNTMANGGNDEKVNDIHHGVKQTSVDPETL